jgi:hypothetical protein
MSEEQDPSPEPQPETRRLRAGVITLVVAAVAAVAAVWWLLAPAPPKEASVASTPAPVAAPAPVTSSPAAPETTPAPKPRPARKAETPTPATPAAPAAPTTGELHIDSDVPGAMVFLDRKFIGNTPAAATDVPPGTHHLNLTAEGFDGYSNDIEVAAGPADVMVRFKEVRLNEKVDVVHKHAFGSCEGRLLADPQGVRYETTNKSDAFSMKYAEIETFAVDYLKKNLVIKKRGGKQYNFTTKAENADPLFVFHRNVDKVRTQVTGGSKK